VSGLVAAAPEPERRPGVHEHLQYPCGSAAVAEAERYFAQGVAYCDEHDITTMRDACAATGSPP
jgi:hypothetical protein